MKTLATLLAVSALAFVPSCAPVYTGLPEDQPTMMRLHRTTSSEDFQEADRTRGGSLINPRGGDWNF